MLLFRKLTFWLALAGLLSAGQLVFRMRASINEPIPAPPFPPPAKPFARAIGAAGLVEANRENTSVAAPIPSVVQRIEVAVWDQVRAGDPLFYLDARELQAALLTQRAQVEVSLAQAHRVRQQLDRLKGVSDARAIAAEEVSNRENELAVAEAQIKAALAAVAQSEALLARLVVRAPRDGTVLQVNVRAGEFTSPSAGAAPVVLGDLNLIQVRADVDEQVAPRVRPGRAAVGYLKGDATRAIPLEFVRIEPFVIPKRSLTGASIERVDTRVLQVIYRFPASADHRVYVGQQLDVFIDDTESAP